MKIKDFHNLRLCGPGSSVGIATELPGWTLRVSNPIGGEIFRTCPDRPWGPTSLLYNGYRVFPGGKERPGRDADLSTLSSAVVKNSTTPMGRKPCTEPQCLYKVYFTFTYSFTGSFPEVKSGRGVTLTPHSF